MKVGIFGRNEEQWKIDAKKGGEKGGKTTYEKKVGCYGLSQEQKIENSKKGGTLSKELGVGIHGRTKEQMSADGKLGGTISGQKHKQNKTGVCGRSREEIIKGGKNWGKKGSKKTNSQKWICLETGFISTPGALSNYQKKKGIDTSKRKRIS